MLPSVNLLMVRQLPEHTAFHDMQNHHQQDFLLPMNTDPVNHHIYTNTT